MEKVVFIEKHGLAVIAPVCDVVRCPGNDNTCNPWHNGTIAGARNFGKHKTRDGPERLASFALEK